MYTTYTSKNQSITLLKGYGVSLIRKAVLVFAFVGIALCGFGEFVIDKDLSGEIRTNGNAVVRYGVKKVKVSGNKTIVAVNGDLFLENSLTVADGAILIVEGNMVVNKGAKLTIDGNSSVVVKKTIGGGGEVELLAQGNRKQSMLTVFEGLNSSSLDITSNFSDDEDAKELFYIKGASVVVKKNDVSVDDEESYAYIHAKDILVEYAELLPIELTYFTAHESENAVVFDWQTASEINNDFFTVEYSLDGIQFNECAVENGNGTTSETHNYSVSVSSDSFYGVTYFRLKQTDFNGEYSYSNVILLDIDSNPSITLYPNPAVDRITINGEFEQAFYSNVYGRTVAVQQGSDKTFNVSTLPSGLYYVTVVTKRGKQVISFVKD